MGGVIVLLTRGMGERLTYGIPARYPVVLVERLGGLFFDGRRSCTEDSFVGCSGWKFAKTRDYLMSGVMKIYTSRKYGHPGIPVILGTPS